MDKTGKKGIKPAKKPRSKHKKDAPATETVIVPVKEIPTTLTSIFSRRRKNAKA